MSGGFHPRTLFVFSTKVNLKNISVNKNVDVTGDPFESMPFESPPSSLLQIQEETGNYRGLESECTPAYKGKLRERILRSSRPNTFA